MFKVNIENLFSCLFDFFYSKILTNFMESIHCLLDSQYLGHFSDIDNVCDHKLKRKDLLPVSVCK